MFEADIQECERNVRKSIWSAAWTFVLAILTAVLIHIPDAPIWYAIVMTVLAFVDGIIAIAFFWSRKEWQKLGESYRSIQRRVEGADIIRILKEDGSHETLRP